MKARPDRHGYGPHAARIASEVERFVAQPVARSPRCDLDLFCFARRNAERNRAIGMEQRILAAAHGRWCGPLGRRIGGQCGRGENQSAKTLDESAHGNVPGWRASFCDRGQGTGDRTDRGETGAGWQVGLASLFGVLLDRLVWWRLLEVFDGIGVVDSGVLPSASRRETRETEGSKWQFARAGKQQMNTR